MLRLQPNEFVEACERFAKSAELEQSERPHIKERAAARIEREAPRAAIKSGFVVGGLKQDGGVVLDELDVGRLDRQRARHQELGLREISGAGLGDAEEMQSVKIVGIFAYEPAVEIGGFAQPAAAAQGVRRLQGVVILGFQHRKGRPFIGILPREFAARISCYLCIFCRSGGRQARAASVSEGRGPGRGGRHRIAGNGR